MTNILPRDLAPKATVSASAAIIFDDGTGVYKATPAQIVAGAGNGGGEAVKLSTGQSVEDAFADTFRSGTPFSTSLNAANPDAYGIRVDSVASGKQVDSYLATNSLLDASSAGYGFHAVVTAAASVPFGNGGAIGGAFGGDGAGCAIVGNRRDAGFGHGVIGSRYESGNGSGVLGSFQGTGTGAGVTALFQNTNGAPGGPHGTGPALQATNSSDQGEAISSITTVNNLEALSNTFDRQNPAGGIITRFQMLAGGVRTSGLTGAEILLNPGTASTGAGVATGLNISLSANITGSAQAAGITISNVATGGTANYGLLSVVSGTNPNNFAGRFSATGGTNNFSVYCAAGRAFFGDGVTMASLPVFADNTAASATLHAGDIYRTSTGQVMVVF